MEKQFKNGCPIISIIGQSGSGKTTLIEKLLPVIKSRGYKAGVIKHTHHQFEIDYPGKDTYRMYKAGAETVLIISKEKMAVIKNLSVEKSLKEVVNRFFLDADLVLVEGYKNQPGPKIAVTRSGMLPGVKTEGLAAVIVNGRQTLALKEDTSIPYFHMDEIEKVANWLEEIFCEKRLGKR